MMSVTTLCQAEPIFVVVSKSNPISQLTKMQVVDIYMGRYIIFPNGKPVTPLDLGGDSETKKNFYKLLVDKDIANINAYWARLLFSGRANPPETVDSIDVLLARVRTNDRLLAYVPEAEIDESVKIVFELK